MDFLWTGMHGANELGSSKHVFTPPLHDDAGQKCGECTYLNSGPSRSYGSEVHSAAAV